MYSDILSDLIITKVFFAGTVYNEAGTKRNKMHRNRWAIIQKYEGETEYYMNGKTYVSNKTNMVILPKGAVYDWRCTNSGNYTICEFDSNKTHGEILTFGINLNLSEKLLRSMKEIEYKRTLHTPFCEMECIKEIYSILLKLCESTPKEYMSSGSKEKIAPAVEYIAKNYDKSISNDELSKMCGISTVYFRKLFTLHFGMSPINYIHILRAEKAKELLCSDYGSITDIALSLGYPSIYDFSRTFKKHTGISPRKYVYNIQSGKHPSEYHQQITLKQRSSEQ